MASPVKLPSFLEGRSKHRNAPRFSSTAVVDLFAAGYREARVPAGLRRTHGPAPSEARDAPAASATESSAPSGENMDVALHSAGLAEPPPEKDVAVPLVKIPPPYRGPTAGRASVEVSGSTVRECLLAASDAYPGLGELVLDGDGSPHRFVTLFINGDEIAREDLDAAIQADDELEVLAAIAGG